MTTENIHGFGAVGLQIEKNYDTLVSGRPIAWHFDRLVSDPRVAPFNEYFDETLLTLLGELKVSPKFTMIDMGCGNGKTLARVKNDFSSHPGRLMGIDLSREMVSIARRKFPSFEIIEGDIRNALPNEKNIADVITCINAIHYLPSLGDVRSAYLTAFRLLKPGGWYILATGDQASTARWRDMTEDELRQWIAKGRQPMDWSMPDENLQPVFRLRFYPYLNEEHQSVLEAAGFDPIRRYRQFPPSQRIKQLSTNVYKILNQSPVFIFFVAQKPT